MAEVQVDKLPLTPSADFTDSDKFLILDNGKLRLLERPTFHAWILQNVQGEQGIQGVAGRDGKDGLNGVNGTNGKNGLSAYQVAIANGFTGTEQAWLESIKGATGETGINGFNGWSPVIATASRGTDVVLQLLDWTGGTGTKPSITGYLSTTGIVSNIANATNVRGLQGIQGIQGVKGDTGEAGADGVDGKTVSSIVFNPDLSITVNYSDTSTVTSETPPKQYGWGTYKDGQYTDVSPFTITTNSQSVLPNNATTKTEIMPKGVTTFYNTTSQKYLMTDTVGFYSIRVRFKVAGSNQSSYVNVSMSKDTTETPYSQDRVLRGDGQIQNLQFETVMYGDSALATNGLTIRVKTFDRAISIYNIEVTVAKLI